MIIIHDSIIHSKDTHIWCYNGFDAESVIKRKIYIDISSLITLNYLDLLDTLNKVFSEVRIPQSVYDELKNIRQEKPSPDSKEEGSLIRDAQNNIRFIKGQYPYEKWINIGKRICDFIKNNKNIEIVGTPIPQINTLPKEFKKLYKMTTSTFDIDVLVYGYTADYPIMFENNLFRLLYNSLEKSPQSFCIVDYLKFLLHHHYISIYQYYSYIIKLCKANYMLLPIDSGLIFYSLDEHNGYTINPDNEFIYDSIDSTYYNTNYIIENILVAIYFIWQQFIPTEVKERITDYFFDKLLKIDAFKTLSIKSIKEFFSRFMAHRREYKNFVKFMDKYQDKIRNNDEHGLGL
jgi:hypothetical protein